MAARQTQVKCVLCKKRKPRTAYRSDTARRCLACDAARVERAICRSCGNPSGFRLDGRIRAYCDRPECFEARQSTATAAYRTSQAARRARRKTYVCPFCAKRKPLTLEHFTVRCYDDDGNVKEFDRYCRTCRATDHRIRYATDERRRVAARERARRRRVEIKARCERDPVFAAAYYAKRQRWEQRRRARRDGDPATTTRSRTEEIPSLAAAPLAAALRRTVSRRIASGAADSVEVACQAIGTTDRTLRAWETGERDRVLFDLADTIVTNLHLNWWDVWDADEYPDAAAIWDPEAVAA